MNFHSKLILGALHGAILASAGIVTLGLLFALSQPLSPPDQAAEPTRTHTPQA